MELAVLLTIVPWLVAAFPAGDSATLAAGAACALAPRAPRELARLAREGADGPAFPLALDSPAALPPLESVGAATAAAVAGVGRDVAACFGAREPVAGLGGFSDDLIRRIAGGAAVDDLEAQVEWLADPESPLSTAAPAVVRDAGAGRLADGRVALRRVLTTEYPQEPTPLRSEIDLLFVFVDEDGRWLLDDVLVVGLRTDGTPEP